ncbi:MAG: ATP synthase F1 subunit epsilon [Pseudomonadota bacterium]
MADALTFELVSPAKKLASSEAEAVTIPGMQGDLTAMANHAPFLTTMRPGFVTVRTGSTEDRYFVTGGFAEISDNVVSVLAEQAVPSDAVTQDWLDAQIADAEEAATTAPAEREQAMRQRLADLTAVKQSI